MTRVAIIGGGPAGLVSAKECLNAGLNVTVFERNTHHSGLWNNFSGAVWAGMRANLSKESCAFPDFPWPDKAPLFPTQADMVQYLQQFSNHFDLGARANILYDHRVENIQRNNNDYTVQCKGKAHKFDKVIVASGFFTKPYIPESDVLEGYQGVVCHSSKINPFDTYAGRKVLVVGNGFSGCDIAAGLAEIGADVHHLFRRGYYLLPREFEDGETIDSLFYRHSDEGQSEALNREEEFAQIHQELAALCRTQFDTHPLLKVDASEGQPPHISVTTGYLEQVKDGRIDLIRGNLNSVDNINVYDDIVFATGFRTDLSFLDRDILDAISYEPQNSFMPIALYEGVWNNKYSDIAFVGIYRGPFFLTMSMQAKWVAQAFHNPNAFQPSQEEISAGVMRAIELNNENPRRQFPYGDYVGYIERISDKIGLRPHNDGAGSVLTPQNYAQPMMDLKS